MEQDIGNRRHLAGAPMIDLPYDWDISPTLPNFCYRIKYWKKMKQIWTLRWFSSDRKQRIWNLKQTRAVPWGIYVQGQVSKVKFTVWKSSLIAKLFLYSKKSKSLNLMAMSEFWSEAAVNSSLCACAVQMGQKQPRTTGATSVGFQVAMHSQLPPFLHSEL